MKLGFARPPNNEEERALEGYVVFHEKQIGWCLNVDEVCLYLDGKAEKGAGRPGSTPSCEAIPDAGTATNKSSTKVTVQFGIAGDQFIPPHIIVSSSAAEGRAKLSAKMFDGYQEIVGQFRCSKPHHWPALFSVNKSR